MKIRQIIKIKLAVIPIIINNNKSGNDLVNFKVLFLKDMMSRQIVLSPQMINAN